MRESLGRLLASPDELTIICSRNQYVGGIMKKVTFGWLTGPLFCLVLLALFIGIERAGVRYEYQLSHLDWMPSDFAAEKGLEEAAEGLILYIPDG